MTKDNLQYSDLRNLETEQAKKHRETTLKRAEIKTLRGHPELAIADIGYFSIEAGLKAYDHDFKIGDDDKSLFLDIVDKVDSGNKKLVRILDVGCGIGQFARDIAKKAQESGILNQVSIDEISLGDGRDDSQRKQDESFGINFIDGDVQEVKFPPEHFDLIVARLSVTHIVDPLRAIKRLYRFLAVGGEMYLSLSREDLVHRFFKSRYIRLKEYKHVLKNPNLLSWLFDEAGEDVNKLLLEFGKNNLEYDFSEKRLYIKKTGSGKLNLGDLGYSKDVLISKKKGFTGEGLYRWKSGRKETIFGKLRKVFNLISLERTNK